MYALKPIAREDISSALERAERYRLMNEPKAAESICLDVLEIDPKNQEALKVILLALSEQFKQRLYPAYEGAVDALNKLSDEYSKAFYNGIILERRAKAHLAKEGFGAGRIAYGWFSKAMKCYEQAMELRPPGNPDAILRWNTCARFIMENREIRPAPSDETESMLE